MKDLQKNTSSNSPSKNSTKSFFSATTIQPKLTIDQLNDPYEKEADAMADQVMRMPKNGPAIQKQCSACDEKEKIQPQRKNNFLSMKPMLQTIRKPLSSWSSNPLMRKSESGGGEATPELSSQLNNSKGGGTPLPAATNQFMSNAFGNDFSNVRVHTGTKSIQMNQDLQARAFTHGSDLYFNKGEYSPESSSGKSLLAHELTHVVQQSGGLQKKIQNGNHSFQPQDSKVSSLDSNNLQTKQLDNQNEIQLQESEEASGLRSSLSSVKIWLKAFIPGSIPGLTRTVPSGVHAGKAMFSGPTPLNDCFLTDNRSWDSSLSAEARMNSVIDLDLSGVAAINRETHWCDATTELDCEDGDVECSQHGDSSRMRFLNLRTNTSGQVLINLVGAANNPCFSGSPDIDYNGVIMIDPLRRIAQFQGNIDGFPDYEMYINGTTIMREAHPTGNTPGNLIGGANRVVSGRTTF